MEAVIKIKLLIENINKNDIEIKNLLNKITQCDSDIIELNKLSVDATKRMTEARHYLSEFTKLLNKLSEAGDEDWAHYEAQAESMQNQLEVNGNLMRKSILNSQRHINEQNRSKLFANDLRQRKLGQNSDGSNDNKDPSEEVAAKQASNLTEDLKALNRMLSIEVEKSNANLSTLVSSSELVTENSEEFKVMSNYITNSKTLLERYERRGFTDKVLVILAFSLYFSCLFYVIFNRL